MNSILKEKNGGVVVLTLNRPDRFNCFNLDMARQLQQALDEAAALDEVRAVLLTGSGKAFCAGQDLNEAIDPNGPGIRTIVRDSYNPIITKLREMEKPVVCAVNGVAAGAGANIAFACDMVLAAESSSFIQAFSKIGLVPDSGGTFYLPRIIGPQRALALMMSGDKLSAAEALQYGLVYKVVADDRLKEEALNMSLRLSEMPTKGLAYTKKLVNASFNNTLEQQLLLEEEFQGLAGETNDYREGVNAFIEKRKPLFKGN